MKYNPEKHHRKSTRLTGHDYSQSGAYFVTICTQPGQAGTKKDLACPGNSTRPIYPLYSIILLILHLFKFYLKIFLNFF
jgi:hypothetical protein